jgi:hypothetical protein
MEQKSVEEILVELIKEAISKIRNKRNEISKKRASFWGYGLGYFITDLLKAKKDSNFRGKWIDDVEWKSLTFTPPNQIKGFGELWWGPKKDYSKLYSETFYGEIIFEDKAFSSYLFQFQIAGKDYELKR